MIRKFTPAWFFYGACNAAQHFAERVPGLRGFASRRLARKFARVSFSQFGEDLVLRNLFPHAGGFYVDAGAYDPFQFSNTAIFHAAGWSGVNIDASESAIARFNRLRPRDRNVLAALSDVEEDVEFEMFDAGVFSRIGATDDAKPEVEAAPFRKVKMRTRRLGDVLRDLGVTQSIDFLSVDCEGHDLRVLQSNDWAAFRPKAVVVEDYDRTGASPIVRYLASLDYEPLALTGMSRIFVCQSAFPASAMPQTHP